MPPTNTSTTSSRTDLLSLTNLCCFLTVCLFSGYIQTHLHPSASNKSSSITTRGINSLLFVIGISASWHIITMILIVYFKREERVTEQDPDLYDWLGGISEVGVACIVTSIVLYLAPTAVWWRHSWNLYVLRGAWLYDCPSQGLKQSSCCFLQLNLGGTLVETPVHPSLTQSR